ncbi:MAG: TetR/AcrR family transcriptional regulator [Steroidobacteraceae bacterium]
MANEQVAKVFGRSQAQCGRILDAAEQCFIKFGFHAASMSTIAEAAGMSPGLIYRYFDSKSAIIKAIIERQLCTMRADMMALQSGADFTSMIAELFASWQRGDPPGMNPVLYLELTAQSTRDSDVADACKMSDEVSAGDFRAWLKQQAKIEGYELTDAEAEQSHFAVRCFIDGLALRAVRDPELSPAMVAASLQRFLPALLDIGSRR